MEQSFPRLVKPDPDAQVSNTSLPLFGHSSPSPKIPLSVPIMRASDPGTSLRDTILADLHSRLHQKIMYLENITLGDEEISARLSRLYRCK